MTIQNPYVSAFGTEDSEPARSTRAVANCWKSLWAASAVAPHLPEKVLELPLVVNELGLLVLAHVAEDAGVALAVPLDVHLLGPDVAMCRLTLTPSPGS